MEIVYPARIVESQSRSTNKCILISTPNLFMPPPVPVACTPTTLAVDNISIPNIRYELLITVNDGIRKIVSSVSDEFDGPGYETEELPWVLQYILQNAGVQMVQGGGGMYDFYKDRRTYGLSTVNFYGNECPIDNEICNTTTVIIEPPPNENHETSLYRMIAKNGEPRIVMRSCASLYAPGT